MMDTIERREMWTHCILAVKPLASSAILTNNIAVVARAPSRPACSPGSAPVYIMVFNGLLIGVIGSACYAPA